VLDCFGPRTDNLAEFFRVGNAYLIGSCWIENNCLQSFRSHYRAQPTARGIARRIAEDVRERNRSPLVLSLSGNTGGNDTYFVTVFILQRRDELVIFQAAVFIAGYQLLLVLGQKQNIKLSRLRFVLEDNRPEPQPVEILPGRTSRVSFLDSKSQRAFRSHGDPAELRRPRAGQRACSDDKGVFRAKRISKRRHLFVHNFGDKRAAPQIPPLRSQFFHRYFFGFHVHS